MQRSCLKQCPHCGVYFAKLGTQPISKRGEQENSSPAEDDTIALCGSTYYPSKKKIRSLSLAGGSCWLSCCFGASTSFSVIGAVAKSCRYFLHHPNLAFHEAGHILFIPLGEFMTILGGSLMQCLVPFILCIAFLTAPPRTRFSQCLLVVGRAKLIGCCPVYRRCPRAGFAADWGVYMVDMRILRHDLAQYSGSTECLVVGYCPWPG